MGQEQSKTKGRKISEESEIKKEEFPNNSPYSWTHLSGVNVKSNFDLTKEQMGAIIEILESGKSKLSSIVGERLVITFSKLGVIYFEKDSVSNAIVFGLEYPNGTSWPDWIKKILLSNLEILKTICPPERIFLHFPTRGYDSLSCLVKKN